MAEKVNEQYVSSSDLAKNVSKTLDKAKEYKKVFILRNSAIDAVLLDTEEYDRLAAIEELMENINVLNVISERDRNDDGVRYTLEEAMVRCGLTDKDFNTEGNNEDTNEGNDENKS